MAQAIPAWLAAAGKAVGGTLASAGPTTGSTVAATAAGTTLKTAATIGASAVAAKAAAPGGMRLPAVPTRDEAKEARQTEDALRRRRGTAATILTSPLGTSKPQTAAKTLLGQ